MSKIETKKTCFTTITCKVGRFTITVSNDPDLDYEVKIAIEPKGLCLYYNPYLSTRLECSKVEATKMMAILERMIEEF